jgi:hypothetical protein
VGPAPLYVNGGPIERYAGVRDALPVITVITDYNKHFCLATEFQVTLPVNHGLKERTCARLVNI